ncbi:pyrroloquinoline quinone biosynthesis protein PqqD [Chelatococcus reniformis]|uniref:Pyrroloquinoline quinone biosynthesis protein PqqD n=1 Tax=Chelatococcus reniformis TaxID=1494448 RepID=A0A916XLM3_9HYPH|nr:pyrroloquinoline quinone biosynthesis protein PqqD [Chelatococcus reniformis]
MTFADTDVPHLPAGVRLKSDAVRGTVMLLAPERAFTLNPVAVKVLGLVDGERSVGAIVAALAQEFNAPPEAIAADVIELLDELARKRVVER